MLEILLNKQIFKEPEVGMQRSNRLHFKPPLFTQRRTRSDRCSEFRGLSEPGQRQPAVVIGRIDRSC